MKSSLVFLVSCLMGVALVFAQGKPEDTLRAGSSGSAGTTHQGPVYDGGVTGPNATMGYPDTTAVQGAQGEERPSKKFKGTIRLDGGNPATTTEDPSEQGPMILNE